MITHRLSTAILILVLCSIASGCSSLRFPGVHRITIQQGNVITQTMIDKLKPGMSKSQVRFVLGNAVINDSLNQDRWDYVYNFQPGGGVRGPERMSVFFVEDALINFTGDFVPTSETAETETTQSIEETSTI